MNLHEELAKYISINSLSFILECDIPGFVRLHDDIDKIDKEAAENLVNLINNNISSFVLKHNLMSVTVWSETPQGHDYWEDIFDKLSEKEEGR